ncbi:YciC family protein [Halostagnicola sp. A-GB9-2]|uniref:YciC family protein n=1 Tax=Halostagnicola sp. A-GB9-2 TaxID=3048066 RepID=UPI0024C06196|nr:YciC family protein [Halostagnicola sp. A-GB9-2]MDJ1432651.1 YciC family protein [Halostagnicola sp. A-GB9-2]
MPSDNNLQYLDYVFDIPGSTKRSIASTPELLVLLLGVSFVLVEFYELVDQYSWQFVALASQLAPTLFEQQYVFSPRTPLVFAFVVALALAIGWLFAFVCATGVCRIAASTNSRLLSRLTALRRGFATSRRTFVLLFTILVLTGIGILLLVVPGVIAAIRLFVALPVLVLEDRSVRSSIRKSWRVTSGQEVRIGLVVACLVGLTIGLAWIPVLGPVLAFVGGGFVTSTATVAVYDALE